MSEQQSSDHQDLAGSPDSQAFHNPAVDPAGLPDYNEPALMPVAAPFKRYVTVSTLIHWALPLLGAGVVVWLPVLDGFPLDDGRLVAAVALLALVTLLYRRQDANRRAWAMREHDLIAAIGIFWRSITVLPVARIQHVETSHGPLERWFGLARVKLFTAGGMTADLVLLGLERDQADQLREYLVEQIRLRERAGHERPGQSGPSAGEPDHGAESQQ